jgi:hypothetical protein
MRAAPPDDHFAARRDVVRPARLRTIEIGKKQNTHALGPDETPLDALGIIRHASGDCSVS